MPKVRSLSPLLLLVVAAFLITGAAPMAAALSGSVSDCSGARIVNANVTLKNAEKGITREFRTDSQGNFSFPLLPAGTYTLTAQAAGFKTFKQEGITLDVGQSASQGITLTAGTTEQIEVVAQAPPLTAQGTDSTTSARVNMWTLLWLPPRGSQPH